MKKLLIILFSITTFLSVLILFFNFNKWGYEHPATLGSGYILAISIFALLLTGKIQKRNKLGT